MSQLVVPGAQRPETPHPPQVVAWERDHSWTGRPLGDEVGILLVGAHPDDETIGAGRLAAAHRGRTRAVTLSAGERCVVGDAVDRDDLRERRLVEWRAATEALGVEAVETERWPDGELASHEAAMVDLLGTLLVEGVDAVVSVWRHDPHPDHEAVGRACATAARAAGLPLVEYPVWAPYWMTPAQVDALGYRICAASSTPAGAEARQAALKHYSSQTEPLAPGLAPVVPPAMLRRHDRQLLAVPHG